MKVQLRRYAAGAVAAGALAAVGAYVLPTGTSEWKPVTYGLTASPEQLLPATVSEAEPARVVSTTIDADGRPVVKVRKATDKASATKLVKQAQEADNAIGVEIDAKVVALDAPTGSDLYRSRQWDLTTMRAAEAWQKSTGAGVTVAVIDTGVDATNVDLSGKVLAGYDATTDKVGGNIDPNGHGTHVAGTIGAVTGNTIGVSSVAPDTRILPVRVLGADGSGYMSDTAEGIIWAADHGAQVINMSLGSDTKVAAVSNAIAYARGKGVTVVAAAGNEREEGSPTSYPGADTGVIAVAATDSSDRVAYYSNAGSYVDVAAPGSAILSTYPAALGNSYGTMSGTSMASPHVAALAALLKAAKPGLTPDQIEQAMKSSAVDLGTAGKDNDYGYGRVDAVAALAAVATPTSAPTTAPTTVPTTAPTTVPTIAPTTVPTTAPTVVPTIVPTPVPTTASPAPSKTVAPTPSKTTVTPTPSASTTAPPATLTLKSSVTSREVNYGISTTTTFTVQASGKAWAKKTVSVCVTETGSAESCTDAVTTTSGTVAVPRVAKTAFQLQVKVAASAANLAAVSPVATYTVKATATVSRPGKGTLSIVLGGVNGQSVQFQQYVANQWMTAATYQASAKVTVSGVVAGRKYRVVVPDSTGILGVTSTAVTA
jgi:serine protease